MPDVVTIGDATLYLGDCRDILPTLAAGSVDAVVTDPPYPKEFIPVYADCWRGCDTPLKHGGQCFAMVGQYCLPDVINGFPKSWEYLWCGCFQGAQMATSIWPRGISAAWKPLLIYGKSFSKFKPWKYDTIAIEGGYRRDKEHHEWGQSVLAFRTIIDRFNVGETILDPFMGAGTTGIAAVMEGRKFVGIEIDRTHFETSCRRIREAVDANERSLFPVRYEHQTLPLEVT